jgi:hypothetical protein
MDIPIKKMGALDAGISSCGSMDKSKKLFFQ